MEYNLYNGTTGWQISKSITVILYSFDFGQDMTFCQKVTHSHIQARARTHAHIQTVTHTYTLTHTHTETDKAKTANIGKSYLYC